MKLVYFTILIAAGIVACTSTKPPQADGISPEARVSVIQPLPGFEIKPRHFNVSATEASVIELPNGGSVAFPDNAFVDAAGNPITGTVTVAWQEFHSLTDIMVSGIPMDYDSAGVQNHFISGGMFTIDAAQNGHEVELAKGKEATVALATYDPKPSYNFYSLDESTGKWSYDKTAVATPNPKAVPEPVAAAPKKASRSVFLDLQLPVSKDSFPELAGKDILGWNVDPAQLNNKMKGELGKLAWNGKLKSKAGDNYAIELTNGKNTIRVNANPVFMETALAGTKEVDARNETKWDNLLAFQQQQKQANMLRTATIPGFGTYNWDYVHMRENPIEFALTLEVPEDHPLETAQIYHVCPEERSIIHYDVEDLDKFSFDPNKGNCIVIIFPDKTVHTISDKGFDEARSKRGSTEFTFDTDRSNERFQTADQLGRMVNRLI